MKDSLKILINPPTLSFKERGGIRKVIALPDDLNQIIQRTATVIYADESYWKSAFPDNECRRIELILPYYMYENKMLCSDLYDYFSIVFTPEYFHLIPDMQYFLQTRLQGKSAGQSFKVVYSESDHYYIHQFLNSDPKNKFQKTTRFDWKETDPVFLMQGAAGDTYLDPLLTNNERLDTIFKEEFIHLEEKYYVYRVDYDSRITYGMLDGFFQNKAKELQKNIANESESDGILPTFFTGRFTDRSFFRHYFKTEGTIITTDEFHDALLEHDFSNVLSHASVTPLTIKLFSDGVIDLEVFNTHLPKQPAQKIRYFRMLEPIDTEFKPRLNLFGNNIHFAYQLSNQCVQKIFTLPYFETQTIRWRNVGIGFYIDLCDNLVIEWYHQNIKIFSEVIGKI